MKILRLSIHDHANLPHLHNATLHHYRRVDRSESKVRTRSLPAGVIRTRGPHGEEIAPPVESGCYVRLDEWWDEVRICDRVVLRCDEGEYEINLVDSQGRVHVG